MLPVTETLPTLKQFIEEEEARQAELIAKIKRLNTALSQKGIDGCSLNTSNFISVTKINTSLIDANHRLALSEDRLIKLRYAMILPGNPIGI